ncbi:phosphomannomutase/phosphoglucomutase [Neptuniibacter sp. CAU 1671]|uniref:phosphomannomutase/phosphoglucomutase n=1 Tax=Neptuniibacter sp. CAU 1671 TaxID=3032593 RepID=UPI0023DA398F|nr:phosphomannomutase/phosphoglucomutase [Neptuniibacter sp. CAU 1671]MDF2183067.1 phosphomannomutase/phosphoglucomutase [Neptuniibacter sp. CAU 1671]
MRYPLHTLDPTIFRAYDVRGIVGTALSDSTVYHLGRAFAAEARSQGVHLVHVGADGRLSSPALKELFSEGLTDGGCDVCDVGYLPTPGLYYAAHQHSECSGVMITGSHNPADYNGFKMMLAGHTLSGDDIQKLQTRIRAQDYSEGAGSVQHLDIRQQYLERILGDVTLAKPMKVVVDCGNGIPGDLAPQLIERLGCEAIPLYCEVDGNFPNHHPDPGKPKNLQDAIAKVRETGADLGLAFDGDGDRVGVITAKGHIVYPDRLMMLFAEDILSRNPGAEIIFDVKCSRLLAEVIRNAGGTATMWKTGHSLIKQKIKQSGALLGGEMSGHIFFKERWYGFDDALYSAARLLEILSARTDDADALFSAYPEDISTPELNITVTEENKFDIVADLQQLSFDGGAANHIDGVRVDYPDGWGLVRASNTTPVLVLRFEAESESALNRIRTDFQQKLHAIDPELTIPAE